MEIFKPIARFFVTVYANRMFRKAKKIADRKYSERRQHYYVCLSPLNMKTLVVLSRKEFRTIRDRLRIIDKKKSGLDKLKEQCFYRTGDAVGNNPLTPVEVEVRRLAFVKYMLVRAKLK